MKQTLRLALCALFLLSTSLTIADARTFGSGFQDLSVWSQIYTHLQARFAHGSCPRF